MQKKAMEEHEHEQAAPAQSSKKAPRMPKVTSSPEIMQHLHYLHPHTHTSASRHPRTHLRTRTRAPTSAPAPAHLRTRTRTRIRRSCDTTIPTLQHKPCSREHSAGATHRPPRTHARTRSPHTPRTGGGAGRFWSVLVVGARTESRHQKINKNRMGGGDRREGTHGSNAGERIGRIGAVGGARCQQQQHRSRTSHDVHGIRFSFQRVP